MLCMVLFPSEVFGFLGLSSMNRANSRMNTLNVSHSDCRVEARTASLKKETEEVNVTRSLKHKEAGKEISELHKDWTAIIQKNSDIAKANALLDKEIAELRAKLPEYALLLPIFPFLCFKLAQPSLNLQFVQFNFRQKIRRILRYSS